jgi:hypothetical protein
VSAPPIATVAGAPIRVAAAPPASAPNGAMPKNAIV